MSEIEFHRTPMGRRFYEVDFPNMVKQLERIANALEKKDGHLITEKVLH